jgi:DNA-binding SARP family transcriptional activator
MLTSTEHALLFSIARHRHPSTREELIDLVWGEAPPCQAQNAFNVALHRLRRRLGGPDAIVHSMLDMRCATKLWWTWRTSKLSAVLRKESAR